MNIETLKGTMEAHAWHVGKQVAADPSGFNWRIINEQVDLLLDGLRTTGSWTYRPSARATIVVNNYPDKVHIIASDPPGYTETILTAKGRDEFIEVLQSVQGRENAMTEEEMLREYYAAQERANKSK